MNLPVNERTQVQLNSYLKSPKQVLLLHGSKGSGKQELSKFLVESIFNQTYERLVNVGSVVSLTPELGAVEEIRNLIKSLSTKSGESDVVSKVVIMHGIEDFGREAQNALLKTLEEPANTTKFILTASNISAVMPTIKSRSTPVAVNPVTLKDATNFYIENFSTSEITSNWQLTQGKAGLLHELMSVKDTPLKNEVNKVKTFLKMDKYARLVYLDSMSKNRDDLHIFIDALQRVLRAVHHSAIKNGKSQQIQRLNISRQLLIDIDHKLSANTATKLVTIQLALSLKV